MAPFLLPWTRPSPNTSQSEDMEELHTSNLSNFNFLCSVATPLPYGCASHAVTSANLCLSPGAHLRRDEKGETCHRMYQGALGRAFKPCSEFRDADILSCSSFHGVLPLKTGFFQFSKKEAVPKCSQELSFCVNLPGVSMVISTSHHRHTQHVELYTSRVPLSPPGWSGL